MKPFKPIKHKYWQPLVLSDPTNLTSIVKRFGENVLALYAGAEFWSNDHYLAVVRREPAKDGPQVVHVSVRRRDRRDIPWAHKQAIKNDVLGEQYEAVELFPAEDRLVDTANQYHLWAVDDPDYRFPFGWNERITRLTDDDVKRRLT